MVVIHVCFDRIQPHDRCSQQKAKNESCILINHNNWLYLAPYSLFKLPTQYAAYVCTYCVYFWCKERKPRTLGKLYKIRAVFVCFLVGQLHSPVSYLNSRSKTQLCANILKYLLAMFLSRIYIRPSDIWFSFTIFIN